MLIGDFEPRERSIRTLRHEREHELLRAFLDDVLVCHQTRHRLHAHHGGVRRWFSVHEVRRAVRVAANLAFILGRVPDFDELCDTALLSYAFDNADTNAPYGALMLASGAAFRVA